MIRLDAQAAAARFERRDTLGIPLGTGQPPALLAALGERDDWEELRVYGALLSVGTELFTRPGVHYLSGFFGPFERALRDATRTSAVRRRLPAAGPLPGAAPR